MTKGENETGERSFDELASGVADDTLPRSKALKAGFAALLGGLVGILGLSRNAEAAPLPPFWAVVDSFGELERGRGAVRARKAATGNFLVTFKDNVSGGAYSATIRDGANGRIAVLESPGFPPNHRQVLVFTYSSSEDPQDMGFHLVVNR